MREVKSEKKIRNLQCLVIGDYFCALIELKHKFFCIHDTISTQLMPHNIAHCTCICIYIIGYCQHSSSPHLLAKTGLMRTTFWKPNDRTRSTLLYQMRIDVYQMWLGYMCMEMEQALRFCTPRID